MTAISKETIDSLAEKLDGFAKGLSDEERAALGGVLARAEAADADEDEVEKFQFRTRSTNFSAVQAPRFDVGLSSQLSNSLGGNVNPVGVTTIIWGW